VLDIIYKYLYQYKKDKSGKKYIINYLIREAIKNTTLQLHISKKLACFGTAIKKTQIATT